MKKLVCVRGNDLTEVNDLLTQGWSIEKMFAAGAGSEFSREFVCYVYLVKTY